MKRLLSVMCILALLFTLSACNNYSEREQKENNRNQQIQDSQILGGFDEKDSSAQPETHPESQFEPYVTEEKTNMLKFEIIVEDKVFPATLYDNESAKALVTLFPMTLGMSELNGNEKYYYLENKLPTNSSRMSEINAGDIMLYGDNCLVLFYESFLTSYSYTPVGHIDDPTGLTEVLGGGNAQVTFRN